MGNQISRISRFFSIKAKDSFEKIPWKILSLQYHVSEKYGLLIKNRSDWNTYSEVFGRGDYDWAIQKSFDYTNEADYYFLDIGANVGFFSLRLIEAILKYKPPFSTFSGLLIEGSPSVYTELTSRIMMYDDDNISLKILHGLAGKKEGEAKIFESSNYITNSIHTNSSLRKSFSGKLVPYLDIEKQCAAMPSINLLKCDIEGSELEFLEHNFELLTKVKVAVFELHHSKCDTGKCITLLDKAGLQKRKVIFTYGEVCSLEVFWR